MDSVRKSAVKNMKTDFPFLNWKSIKPCMERMAFGFVEKKSIIQVHIIGKNDFWTKAWDLVDERGKLKVDTALILRREIAQ